MNKYTPSSIPSRGRINAFDSLRSFMIFLVIVLHVSMTYMLDTPSWWYVVSDELSAVYLVIVNILDIGLMPVLFFISGYFTPASYLKKGTFSFFKDKTKHIFFPWLLGIVLIAPLGPLFSGKSIDYIIESLKKDPFYFFHIQGHLWYLGILFIFLLIYAIYSSFSPPSNQRVSESNKKNKYVLIILISISIICAYLSTLYIIRYGYWIFLADIITLRPVKIITYGTIFIMGVYAWQKNWFTQDNWMPSLNIWRVLAISTTTCFVLLRLVIIPDYNYPIATELLPVFDAISSYTTLFYVLLVGIKYQNSRVSLFLTNISPYSYGIYWIHIPITTLYLYLINDLPIPIVIKWVSGIAVTCVVSFIISKYILKKTPILKNML